MAVFLPFMAPMAPVSSKSLCAVYPISLLNLGSFSPRSLSLSKMKTLTSTEERVYVKDLRVPNDWMLPTNAIQESEWLRLTLHKWLDDEYCPEAANEEISKRASKSYHESLMEKHSDIGEILLKMANDLQSLSFKESFHGAFSAANAAIHLITERIHSQSK
ncbi:hypothetical protein AMTRI_Chr02g221810 [Amborella trichopoda]